MTHEHETSLAASQQERREIARLYYRAADRRDSMDDDNIEDYYRLRAQADRRLAAWREQYPDDARYEDAGRLRAQATHERSLAAGALTYDADGWLSADEQQRRHDDYMAKATELEAQATALEEE